MTALAIGFIGFGEAGYHFARGLGASAQLFAYDIHVTSLVRARAAETGTVLVESPGELAERADTLLCVVTANSAFDVARQNVGGLKERHVYADMNSVSPNSKRTIAATIGESQARFAEVAIMAPVPPYGHKVPLLINGPGAGEFRERLQPLGLRIDSLTGEIGAAAAVKMCRSIVVKGLEALLFECVLGASRYGADERVLASLDESFPGMKIRQMADYMVGRVVVHGERRAREMEEVAEALRDVGLEPTMAEATARFQDWSSKLDLKAQFGPKGPAGYREVVELIGRAATE